MMDVEERIKSYRKLMDYKRKWQLHYGLKWLQPWGAGNAAALIVHFHNQIEGLQAGTISPEEDGSPGSPSFKRMLEIMDWFAVYPSTIVKEAA